MDLLIAFGLIGGIGSYIGWRWRKLRNRVEFLEAAIMYNTGEIQDAFDKYDENWRKQNEFNVGVTSTAQMLIDSLVPTTMKKPLGK